MIAIDTNVLVRFLVRDEPNQAARAKALVERIDMSEERAYISDIVLCELVWVLTRSYKFGRAQVVGVLYQLAAAEQLRFGSVDMVVRALTAYAQGRGDFADYLIREHAAQAGCKTIATFDKALLTEDMFESP